MVNSNKGEKNSSLAFVLGILLVTAAISSVAISPTDIVATKKSSKSSLMQMPSESTDFPNDDPNAIEVHVTSAKKDSIGAYHVRGEIKNISNEILQSVLVTAHLLDESGQPVAVTTCCYTTPTDIDPGHTSPFDSFSQKDELSGTPTSYRLSFDWR